MVGETPRAWGFKDLLDISRSLKDLLGWAFDLLRRHLGLLNALERYRKKLLTNLDQVEQPLLQTAHVQPRRSELYIDQMLTPVRGERRVDLDWLVAGGGSRFLIRGDAGDGKSTVLKEFVARTIDRARREGRRDLLPAFLRLGSLFDAPSPTSPPDGAIVEAIVEAFRPYVGSRIGGDEAARERVAEARNRGELVVGLDGLDECVDYDRAVAEIRRFCQWCGVDGRNVVAVTCRTSRLPAGLTESLPLQLAVEPLSLPQMYEFLDRWPRLSGRLAGDLKTRLMASPDIRAFCTNPLVLTLVVHLYLEGSRRGASFEIPPTRVGLYNRVFSELLLERRQNRGQRSRFPAEGKRLILRELAFARFWSARTDPERIEADDLARAIAAVLAGPDGPGMGKPFSGLIEPADGPGSPGDGPPPRLTPDGEALLDELEMRDGVLVALGGERRGDDRPAAYHPAHRTLLEFLAAEHAALTGIASPEAMRDRFRSTEFNLLLFYAGLVRSADDVLILTKHHRGPDRLLNVARILSSAEAIEDALRRRIAETATGIVDAAMAQPDPTRAADELHALAALAARGDAAFDPAREQLRRYIEHLAGGPVGAAELDRIIRTTPDPLLDILYDLRDRLAPDWRAALIRGLSDRFAAPDGPVALRRLVGFLIDDHPAVRHEAAAALARAVDSIPRQVEDLRNDELFREQPDAEAEAVWPLGRLFPAKIAYRLAAAADRPDGLVFKAFEQAHRAHRGHLDTASLRDWRRSYAHWRRDATVVRATRVGLALILLGAFLFEGAFLFHGFRGVFTREAYHFRFDRGFRTIPAEATAGLEHFGTLTARLIGQVRERYPQRMVSYGQGGTTWEDTVPRPESSNFEHLKFINTYLDPMNRLTPEDREVLARLGCDPLVLASLDKVQGRFDPRWGEDMNRGWRVPGVWVYKMRWYWGIPLMLLAALFDLAGWLIFIVGIVGLSLADGWKIDSRERFYGLAFGIGSSALVIHLWRTASWQGCPGDWITRYAPILICFAGLMLHRLASRFLRPQNPCLDAVDQLAKRLAKPV